MKTNNILLYRRSSGWEGWKTIRIWIPAMLLFRPLNVLFSMSFTNHHCSRESCYNHHPELWWKCARYSRPGVVRQLTLPPKPRYWRVDEDLILESRESTDDFYTTIERTFNSFFQVAEDPRLQGLLLIESDFCRHSPWCTKYGVTWRSNIFIPQP